MLPFGEKEHLRGWTWTKQKAHFALAYKDTTLSGVKIICRYHIASETITWKNSKAQQVPYQGICRFEIIPPIWSDCPLTCKKINIIAAPLANNNKWSHQGLVSWTTNMKLFRKSMGIFLKLAVFPLFWQFCCRCAKLKSAHILVFKEELLVHLIWQLEKCQFDEYCHMHDLELPVAIGKHCSK